MAVELNSYSTLLGDANLQAYWRFEGNSNDSEASNNGTDTNVTYGAGYGRFGQGASYNGSNAYTNIPYNATLCQSTAMTVNMWVRRTQATISNAHYALFGSIVSAGQDWTLTIPASGGGFTYDHLNFLWYPSNGTGDGRSGWVGIDSSDTFSNLFPLNTWVMLTVTRPSSGLPSGAKMYINGSAVTINTFGTKTPTNNQNTARPIAGNPAGYYLGVDVDDVSYFNRELTSTEISDYYNYSLNTSKFFQLF